MERTTGTFTAPLDGIYAFSFSGVTDWKDSFVSIHVQRNGHREFEILENNDGRVRHHTISTSWMMDLDKGDEINLNNDGISFYVDKRYHIFFNGHLLKKH